VPTDHYHELPDEFGDDIVDLAERAEDAVED
jgi:hypothetical protein